jgi:hypothetical protein
MHAAVLIATEFHQHKMLRKHLRFLVHGDRSQRSFISTKCASICDSLSDLCAHEIVCAGNASGSHGIFCRAFRYNNLQASITHSACSPMAIDQHIIAERGMMLRNCASTHTHTHTHTQSHKESHWMQEECAPETGSDGGIPLWICPWPAGGASPCW